MIDEAAIRPRWDSVGSRLDERGRRLFAAAEVRTAARGGLALVSKITGLARSTINRGKTDLDAQPLPKGRVRRAGGGRRGLCANDPGLVPALKRLVEPATLGDPLPPLIWVSKGMEKLAATLTEMGHPISAETVHCTGARTRASPTPCSRELLVSLTAKQGIRRQSIGSMMPVSWNRSSRGQPTLIGHQPQWRSP
jgi:DDE family transposase